MAKLYLQLATGELFEGESAGAVRDVVGELVFTTGVVGYLETITDPAYRGQIVVQTYPLGGNYGITPDDAVSGEPQLRALILREICDMPANYRCSGTLTDYLRKNKVVCLTGIDTRSLTAILREKGTVNARITAKKPDAPDETLLNYRVTGEVAAAASRTVGIHPAKGGTVHRVAVIDCGDRLRTVSALTARGCMVTVYPPTASAETIFSAKPDGLVITPGPGDPAEQTAIIDTVGALFGKLPIFGIGLGHQLLALAAGAKTVKLHTGHRGANQPVKDLSTGKVYITAQNHGYAVDTAALPDGALLTHINVGDGSCEGLAYPAASAFGMQIDPFGSDGALGMPVFDRFIKQLEEAANHAL
ncbi:MAG: carbamoyl phosphate synthase small subunit [Clostridia bacterium]|nr:carbamoyl phosphate synthase small subunit [Clostridia bacterium]